jgi:hypothetical protein
VDRLSAGRLVAQPAGPGSNIVVIELDNGAVLSYDIGDSASFSMGSPEFRTVERIVGTQWPCRVAEPGLRRRGLGGGLDFVPSDATRVIRLPRCSGKLKTGR